jgi:serine protease Do
LTNLFKNISFNDHVRVKIPVYHEGVGRKREEAPGMDEFNNGYSGYNGHTGQQAGEPRRQQKKHAGAAGIVIGAVLGALIGGLVVGLLFSGSLTTDNVSQQAYIDQAVAAAISAQSTAQLSATDMDGVVEKTVNHEVLSVTTDYSQTIQQVVEAASASVVGVATRSGTGTGVIVSEDGLILTNQHVISQEDASLMFQPGFERFGQQQTDKTITVTLLNGSAYEATVLFEDETMDLAVIRIDATGLTAVTLGDSDSVKVGEITIAIGNPLGLEQTVTSGIVSALDVSVAITNTQIAENLIQTDAAINSGNSGGALLNADGHVIGINSYKLSNGEGIGFAIPINAAKPILNQIIETGEFKQAQIGVSMIDRELLSYYSYNTDIELDKGLYVYEVSASSDASAKGLRQGDVITAVDGVEVDTILEFKTQIYRHLPGDSVTLTVLRDGSEMQMTVMLIEATS